MSSFSHGRNAQEGNSRKLSALRRLLPLLALARQLHLETLQPRLEDMLVALQHLELLGEHLVLQLEGLDFFIYPA